MKSGMKLMMACAILMVGGYAAASGKCAKAKACCLSCFDWLFGANIQAPRENWQRAQMSTDAHTRRLEQQNANQAQQQDNNQEQGELVAVVPAQTRLITVQPKSQAQQLQ